jgi:hypothetical protein
MTCKRCGTELVPRARYCHQCGERVAGGVLQLDDGQIVEGMSRWRWLKYAGIALLVMTALLWVTKSLWLGVDAPPPAPAAAAPTAAPEPRVVMETPKPQAKHYFAVRDTKLRSSMTTEADNIVRTIGRGEDLTGETEIGLDGQTMWLNTGKAGPYVAVINLADQAPPPLDLVVDLPFVATDPVTLYDRPGDDEVGVSVQTAESGAKIHVTGIVGNWFEVSLRKGGVAYFKPATTAEKKLMAKAMAGKGKKREETPVPDQNLEKTDKKT